ncbi:MAG: 3-phosphoshikimate 1-carboxyvinyltransferase [Pseudomonadota bacterium]
MAVLLVSRPVQQGLTGAIRVPGDKSISHRSLMLGALATGTTRVTGLLEGEDCLATAAAMQSMGARIVRHSSESYVIDGVGLRGLRAPENDIYLGNSGTGMRLLCGLLAAQSFPSVLTGDASLSSRPMARVIEPLTKMGANIASENGKAPLRIAPADRLQGIDYAMPLASAQLKSALMLAGLFATSATILREPGPSRDHTERMLQAMGVSITIDGPLIRLEPVDRLNALDIDVPADLSSAAFFLVAASIVSDSAVTLTGVGLNPTRTGVLDILSLMGADISIENRRESGGEPIADLSVRSADLRSIDLDPALVPLAIDEFPILFVAAACARGDTRFSGLAELRHKESDRIGVMVAGLRALGIQVEEGDDWVVIEGGQFQSGEVESHGDHRVAMAFAVAGAVADAEVSIRDPENIATSFPNFAVLAERVGLSLRIGGR